MIFFNLLHYLKKETEQKLHISFNKSTCLRFLTKVKGKKGSKQKINFFKLISEPIPNYGNVMEKFRGKQELFSKQWA